MFSDTGATIVAKKKSKPDTPERKPMIVQVRGSEEFKAWVEGLAALEGDTVAKLVDRALRKWAKDVGYLDPPKR